MKTTKTSHYTPVPALAGRMAAACFALSLSATSLMASSPLAVNDTIAPEREQELGDAVVGGRKMSRIFTEDGAEKITFAGLTKMACCTVAESFQNTASVSTGYSDAVSGTRQIRLLGLGGVYTQLLDESRPIMRGLGTGYALSFTPGVWLSSISVSKGASSVVAGHDAVTGQINMDFRKPTDSEKLFANVYVDEQLRGEVNLTSAQHLKKDKSLSTIILFHGAGDTDWRDMGTMDKNKDGFRDQPRRRDISLANRWMWIAPTGWQVRWGARFNIENRLGGMLHYKDNAANREAMLTQWNAAEQPMYGSNIDNKAANAYLKVARPLGRTFYSADSLDTKQSNVALIVDYDHFSTKSYYGLNDYTGVENSVFANLVYNHQFSYRSSLMVGGQTRLAHYGEDLVNRTPWLAAYASDAWLRAHRAENEVGAYGEYTYALPDRVTLIVGVRGDYNDAYDRFTLTPRGHVKWDITPRTTLRASAGLGYRTALPFTDNLGLLATGRHILINGQEAATAFSGLDRQEKALTAGLSFQQKFSLLGENNATLTLDYFRTQFLRSLIIDQEWGADVLNIYSTTDRAWSDTWQADLTWTPVTRFDITATFRYNNTRQTLTRPDGTTVRVERALTDRYKGVLNLQYATPLRLWVFDATAQLNGPVRLPSQTGDLADDSHSPVYALLYAQVTRKIGRFDIYAGCENIADYRQKDPIIAADAPYSSAFNSLNVWGPLMGRSIYVGLRFNLY